MVATIIFLIFFSVSWIVPDHFPPWTSFHTEVPALVGLFVAIGYRLKEAMPTAMPSQIICVPLILIVVIWTQWWCGLLVYAGDAYVIVLYILSFIVAWLYGYNVSEEKQMMGWSFIELLCLTMVLIGLAVSLQLLAQWLKVEDRFWGWILEGLPGGRPRANVGQPNQAATTQVIALISTIILFKRLKLAGALVWILLILFSWVIVLTQSRTSLLSMGALALVGIYFSKISSAYCCEGQKKIKTIYVFIWVLIVFGMLTIYHTVSWGYAVSGAGIGQLAQPGTRLIIWRQLTSALLDKPFFGFGALQIATAQQVGALLHPGVEQTNYAHNLMLDVLVMFGVFIGGGVLLIFICWMMHRLLKNLHSLDVQDLLLLLLPLMIHSNLEFPHAYSYFLIYAGILLGVFDQKTKILEKHERRLARSFSVVFFLISLFFCALLFKEYVSIEEDFRINRFENASLGKTPEDYVPPKLILLSQFEEVLAGMRIRASENMNPADIDLLVRVSARYSWAPMQFRATLALALNGRQEEASRQLKIIKSLFSPSVYSEAKQAIYQLTEKYPALGSLYMP